MGNKNIDGVINQLESLRDNLALLSENGVDAIVTENGSMLLGDAHSLVTRSEARYRHLMNRMSALIAELTPTGKILYVNDEISVITGFSSEQLIGKNFIELLQPIQESTSSDQFKSQFIDCSELNAFRTRIYSKDHCTKIISWSSAHVCDVNDSIEKIIIFGTDITEQKNLEDKLQKLQVAVEDSRDRYVDLFDFAPVGYITIDRSAMIVDINLTACMLLGEVRSKLVNYPLTKYIASQDKDRWCQLLAHVIESYDFKKQSFDFAMLRDSGAGFYAHFDCLRREMVNSQPTLRIALSDVTELKVAESKLRVAATAFQTQEGMAITDAKGLIVNVNAAFTQLTGYTSDELIGKRPSMISSGRHDAAFYAAMWERINCTGFWDGEIWNKRKSGEMYPERLTITAVKDQGGNVTNYVATHSDITKTINLANELAKHDMLHNFAINQERQVRLASLGTLAGGIAHDFNNGMAMIMGYVEIAKAMVDNPQAQNVLNSIMQVLDRNIGTVSKLAALGSNTIDRLDWFCLATLLTHEYKLLWSSFDNIKLILLPIENFETSSPIEHTSSCYGVIGDKSAFSEILTNLCSNAAKHAFSGRTDGVVKLSLKKIDKENLQLQLIDNGCGIPPDILNKIYEPYFTTGSEADSSGLGLFMVRGIVTRMGGKIECESEVGKGTVFTITLPAVSYNDALNKL